MIASVSTILHLRRNRRFVGLSLCAAAVALVTACTWDVALSCTSGSTVPRRRSLALFQSIPLRTAAFPRTTALFGKRGGGGGNVQKGRVKKSDLPEKICVVCGRPFAWRKKWERSWEEVTCCSKSCNAKRRGGGGGGGEGDEP